MTQYVKLNKKLEPLYHKMFDCIRNKKKLTYKYYNLNKNKVFTVFY